MLNLDSIIKKIKHSKTHKCAQNENARLEGHLCQVLQKDPHD